jgi:hypothetical protein
MPASDPAQPCAQRVRRLHVGHLPDQQRLAAHHARHAGRVDHDEGEHHVALARLAHGHEGDGEDDRGQSEEGVADPHEEIVERAHGPGEEAEHAARHHRERHGQSRHPQRLLAPRHHASEHLAPELIGPERMFPRRRLEP